MVGAGFPGKQLDRLGALPRRGEQGRRTTTRARASTGEMAVLDILARASLLLPIMIGALALRVVPALPHGAAR